MHMRRVSPSKIPAPQLLDLSRSTLRRQNLSSLFVPILLRNVVYRSFLKYIQILGPRGTKKVGNKTLDATVGGLLLGFYLPLLFNPIRLCEGPYRS